MIRRPEEMGAYTFAVLSGLRAAQLMRGCIPRVEGGAHKAIVVAQLEVAAGMIEGAGEPGTPQGNGSAPPESRPSRGTKEKD